MRVLLGMACCARGSEAGRHIWAFGNDGELGIGDQAHILVFKLFNDLLH